MLIVMKADATDAQVAHVCDVITELGFKPHPMPGATRTAIGITGNPGAVDPTRFENLPGVSEAIRVSKPYKLISLDLRPEKTIVRVGDAEIGAHMDVGHRNKTVCRIPVFSCQEHSDFFFYQRCNAVGVLFALTHERELTNCTGASVSIQATGGR